MSPSPCIPHQTYLDTPEFYKLSLHLVTIISTPIYLLGLYCILFKTPDAMKSVKWYILVLHVWIASFDFSNSFLCQPFLFFPEIAGIPYGVLNGLGVPTSLQTVFVMMQLFAVSLSILSIFENRYFILCEFRFKHLWVAGRWIWLLLHYLYCIGMLLSVFLIIPEQEAARKRMFQKLPCLPNFVYEAQVFVLVDENFPLLLTLIAIFMAVCWSELAFFIYQLIRNVKNQQKLAKISQNTLRIQRDFLFTLFHQSFLPFVLLVGPVAYMFLSVFFNYYNQAAVNVCVIVVTVHGLIATLVMLWVHKPYRKAVREIVGFRKKLEVNKTAQMFTTDHDGALQ